MTMNPNKRAIMLIVTMLALLGIAPLLGACNTMAGLGQDISDMGRSLHNSASGHDDADDQASHSP